MKPDENGRNVNVFGKEKNPASPSTKRYLKNRQRMPLGIRFLFPCRSLHLIGTLYPYAIIFSYPLNSEKRLQIFL